MTDAAEIPSNSVSNFKTFGGSSSALLDKFKNGGGTKIGVLSNSSSRQNLVNSATMSSSQQILNSSSSESSSTTKSSTTTSRIAHTSSSQRMHHVSSSSSTSTVSSAELKTSGSRSLLAGSILQPSLTDLADGVRITELTNKIRSLDDLVADDDQKEPLVTFPDANTPTEELAQLTLSPAICGADDQLVSAVSAGGSIVDTFKVEQKRMTSASTKKVITDSFSSEEATSNVANFKQIQANDLEYKEAMAASAIKNSLQIDGVKAEKNAAVIQEQRSLTGKDFQLQDSNNVAAASVKLSTDAFSAEKRSISQAKARQTVTSSGIHHQEKHTASSSQSKITISERSMITSSSQMSSSSSSTTNGTIMDEEFVQSFNDLEQLTSATNAKDVECAISKYSSTLDSYVQSMKMVDSKKRVGNLEHINQVMRRAWAVPNYGHEVGATLCNTLRSSGGLDMILSNCSEKDKALQISSARLLEQCLTHENRSHVVQNGLRQVVNVACECTKNTTSSQVGTGILEHLFKHSETTCSDVVRMGGLEAVISECRKNDVETLRHCAGALANLSLYGGAENQESMIKKKVPMWLFPLAFNDDDSIRYYACLAIAVLVANKEIEAEVLKSGTLDLIEPFIEKWAHSPSEFAKTSANHAHGQSQQWLQRLLPVLSSNREEACNLAAFHFCMEAGIKKEQGNTDIFKEIGAIESLKKVASCPNAIASKFAAQALRLIGEEVPHKLSQQVPVWNVEDVREWVKQIGFSAYEKSFYDLQVDGDLLLQLTEQMLQTDLGMANGITRKRFERELVNLKRMADYSSRDTSSIHAFLSSIGPEFVQYTYGMISAGVDRDSLRQLNDDHLAACGVRNPIHCDRLLKAAKVLEPTGALMDETEDNAQNKCLDVFVSYRRNNGSQLASLLKVHLQLRGFSVFIDVERLEAGKFDSNLLQSIKQAKHFLLVLTPNALERCVHDEEQKDWVHREIVAALNSNCNIVPIIDNFQWPEAEELPEDMRQICTFNGIRWIHDYQDACVDKLERFLRGELKPSLFGFGKGDATPNAPGSALPGRIHPPSYQRMASNDSGKGSDKEANRGSD